VENGTGVVLKMRGSWGWSLSAVYREAPLGDRMIRSSTNLPPSSLPPLSHFPSQCAYTVFVRVYRRWRRFGPIKIPAQIKGGAGPHRIPYWGDRDDSAGTICCAEDSEDMSELSHSPTDTVSYDSIRMSPDLDMVSLAIRSGILILDLTCCFQGRHILDDVLDYMLEVCR
jgi:hypothetical protein